eukprot:TRINITY_DN5204_c0_g1_i4.p1 TRINITY_DN5204_c0_g1~~TRINITY_DN5204_c0_g1_i4.p1  ORF type:complete len:479 (-),score=98.43 TRINITY_DN5204_c0_g1_i4:306-1694(-)
MDGYEAAYNILVTAIQASNSNFMKQNTEAGFLQATLLYRAAAELELKQIVRIQQKNNAHCDINNKNQPLNNQQQQQLDDDDTVHRNRLQWLLVHIGCGRKFTPYTPDKNDVILTLGEAAHQAFVDWIYEDVEKISCGNVFKMAPFVRHSIADVVFFHAWLTRFSSGTHEAVQSVQAIRNRIQAEGTDLHVDRFDQLSLTKSFLVESLDKICLDLLSLHSLANVVHKAQLTQFYHYCIKRHSSSKYFQKKLPLIQDNTSIVSPIWQEILASIQNPRKTNLALIEEACRISITKFLAVFNDETSSQDISPTGCGFLYKLSNLLERCVSQPGLRNSPLIWRLLLWCASIQMTTSSSRHRTDASEEQSREDLKVLLYRAIQDVPWCKALYLDTALYLAKIDQLTRTTTRILGKNAESSSDGENDQNDEERTQIIPGTLDHISELMVEKEIRIRVPLQELDVLLEPV